MKKLVCFLALVAGFGLVALAATTPAPVPDVEAPLVILESQTTLEEPVLESSALLVEPLDDAVQTSSCSPTCSSLRGQACTEGTFKRCYHTCFEPDICTCPDGTYNCP